MNILFNSIVITINLFLKYIILNEVIIYRKFKIAKLLIYLLNKY